MAVAATAVQIGSFDFQLIRFFPLLALAGLQCPPRGAERRAVIGMEKMRSGRIEGEVKPITVASEGQPPVHSVGQF